MSLSDRSSGTLGHPPPPSRLAVKGQEGLRTNVLAGEAGGVQGRLARFLESHFSKKDLVPEQQAVLPGSGRLGVGVTPVLVACFFFSRGQWPHGQVRGRLS